MSAVLNGDIAGDEPMVLAVNRVRRYKEIDDWSDMQLDVLICLVKDVSNGDDVVDDVSAPTFAASVTVGVAW